MAEVLTEERREFGVTPTELAAGHPRMSWGAIFAGAVSALGLWALLYVFGLAIGLSTIGENSVKPASVFTGIWALITPLVALFVGGWVAGRGAGIVTRPVGGVHGLVVWALTTLAGALFVFTLAS